MLAVGLSGCVRTSPAATVARDSAGIRVVANTRPTAAWKLDTAGAVALRGLSAGQVEGAAVALSANDVVVAVDGRIIRYDLAGRRMDDRSCGLEAITALLPAGRGTLVAWDGDALVSGILARDGACGSPGTPAVLPAGSVEPVGSFGDGSVVVSLRDGQMFRVAPLPVRDTVVLYRISSSGAVRLLAAPGAELLTWGGEGGAVRLPPPFPRDAFAAAAGDRLWVADARSGELRGYDTSGRLGMIVRAPIRGAPVEPSETTQWRARLERLSRGYLDEAERRKLESDLTFPSTYAPFTAILISDGGDMWLRAGTAPRHEGRWNVFGADGSWRAEVRVPSDLTPVAVGDRRLVARRSRGGDEDELVMVPLAR